MVLLWGNSAVSFIVFGPGVSDPVSLEQATSRGLLQFSGVTEPVAPTSMSDAAIQNRGAGQGGGQGAGGQSAHTSQAGVYASVADQRRQQREVGPVQLAHQIMSEPVRTLPNTARVADVQALFDQYEIDMVPVVNAEGRIEGVVTRWFLTRLDRPRRELGRQPIRTVVRSPVLTAGPDTNIRELARVLLEQNIHAMPIVDKQYQVVGIVTRGDILRALVNYAPLELWL